MAYEGRVYRILIASPSDVEDEREIAVRVIQEWNDLYSYSRKVVLLPLRWETHTAPEYGSRPQEVINRAIVDHCDLLVGIFWTRLGSPTGAAESGTLEEIERVGKAGKPVMLYFSRVPIDPERIDVSQSEKLREFKTKTYPKGLVETFKSAIEFRDKFAKQLELKVRDLQRSDSSGEIPLSLHFLATDTGESIGNRLEARVEHPIVTELSGVPVNKEAEIKEALLTRIRGLTYVPFPLAITNSSSSGIRNVYLEIQVKARTLDAEVTDTPKTRSTLWSNYFMTVSYFDVDDSSSGIAERLGSTLTRFDADKLQKGNEGWTLAIEWEAIQPQRTRLLRPTLFVYAPSSTQLDVAVKVYGDAFPEPFNLSASVNIEVVEKRVKLEEILPEWRKLLAADSERAKNIIIRN
jgi:hypothetical protein